MAEGEWAAAMEELLEIIMRDKTWNAEAPRKTYMAIQDCSLRPSQNLTPPLLLARRLQALNWWARPPGAGRNHGHAQRLPPQAQHGAELRPCGLVRAHEACLLFVAVSACWCLKSEVACAYLRPYPTENGHEAPC